MIIVVGWENKNPLVLFENESDLLVSALVTKLSTSVEQRGRS